MSDHDSDPEGMAGDPGASQQEQAEPERPQAEATGTDGQAGPEQTEAEAAEPDGHAEPERAPAQTAEPDGHAEPDDHAQPEHARAEASEPDGPAGPEQAAAGAAEAGSQQAGRRQRRRARGQGRWRAPVAIVLIVLGCVFAPISVIAVWTANQVSDTNRYIANIEPLVHEPAIQNALTDKITTQVTSHLNITAYADQASAALTSKGLPRVGALIKSFAPSLASGVAGYVHTAVHKIVTGPRFAHAWVQVNTVAHQALTKVLSGQGSSVSIVNGKVVINLAPLIAVVKQNLSARGFTLINKLPPIHAQLALFQAKDLQKAQALYRLLNDLKIVLPILTLLLLAAGVWIARRHRRALIGAGLGFAASMLVLGAGLAIFRTIYLNSVPPSVLPADAAAAMFDTFIRFIKQALRTLLVVGLVVAIGAFFTGPSAAAVRTRAALRSGLGRIRRGGEHAGVSTGPAGEWTYAHRQILRIGAVALAALIFVFWGRPTALVAILIAVLLLVALGLIELIGRPPARPEAAGPPQQQLPAG